MDQRASLLAESNRKEIIGLIRFVNGALKDTLDRIQERLDELEERLSELEKPRIRTLVLDSDDE